MTRLRRDFYCDGLVRKIQCKVSSKKCKVEEGQKLFETRTGTLRCCPTAVAPAWRLMEVHFILHFALCTLHCSLLTAHFALIPITRIVTVELLRTPPPPRPARSVPRGSPVDGHAPPPTGLHLFPVAPASACRRHHPGNPLTGFVRPRSQRWPSPRSKQVGDLLATFEAGTDRRLVRRSLALPPADSRDHFLILSTGGLERHHDFRRPSDGDWLKRP